ncbi:hypothetical protein [Brevibacterium renqingii]|uniref:hypothetical protein n=1 Tax=Brevibacterium renqingii TaxID=2776916 RepID=UPI001AE012DA|nr:hypothetical protein [Brevibacterium renqingii]
MAEASERPKSLAMLRSHHLNEAVDSVVCFSAVSYIFWVFDFGTGASPSVPQVLVTIVLPVALLKEYILYVSAVKRFGFVEVPRSTKAIV